MNGSVKRVLQLVVGLGLAAVLLIWGLPYFAKTSWADIWVELQRVPLSYAVGFQALMLAGLWCYTFVLTGALRGLTHIKALVLNLCGSSVSNLLPAGGAVGLAATFAICRSWGFTRRATSTTVIVTGVWNALARIALPVIALAILYFSGTPMPRALTDAAIAGTITGTVILVVFVALIASARAAQAIGRFFDLVLGPLLRRNRRTETMSVDALVRDLRARINDVVRSGWLSMTLGMIGYFGFYFLLFLLIMRTTGAELPLGPMFAAYAIGRLLTAVGVTPGGLGVTETATTVAMVSWGADAGAAGAGVILFSIFTHLMEVPLGGLGWVLWSLSPKTEPPPEGEELAVA